MSIAEESKTQAFDRYFSDIAAIVSTLERIASVNARKRPGAQQSASTITDIADNDIPFVDERSGAPEDIDTLIASLERQIAGLNSYIAYRFNIDRLVEKYNLNLKERLIMYVMLVSSLYAEANTVPLRRILELISIKGELYISNYPYLSPTGTLIATGVLTIIKEMPGMEISPDIMRMHIAFADAKMLFVMLEQAPWAHIEKSPDTPQERPAGATTGGTSPFERIIESITPKEIVQELDRVVIGQQRAKRVLAVQSYLHYLRVRNSESVPLRSNIMLIGPTGTGKTFLAKKLSQILALPFVRADVTTLTETGYVGDDVEVVLFDLFKQSRGDMSLAEKGIVFLDEIDKIAKADTHQSTTGNPSDKAVQEALLSMLNGEKVRVPESGDRRMMHAGEGLLMNTHNILFVFGGAFVGLEEIIAKRIQGDATLGFTTSLAASKREQEDMLAKVDMKDLEKYGMIPEFLGRIPIVVSLHKLSKDDMEAILLKSMDSPLVKYGEFFKSLGKRLVVSSDAMRAIVDRAYDMGTGARALKSVVENLMIGVLYNCDDIKGPAIKITKKMVAMSLDELDAAATEVQPVEVKKLA
ncbi:MAG: AAA family ATPase [Spirochaetes bacterium]|nr:AAA family ATPase [Spirochaetota bacterium]